MLINHHHTILLDNKLDGNSSLHLSSEAPRGTDL